MEECKKRYCAWLKAIAIVVLSLFILNNLVWANPDFFQRSVTNVTLQQNLAALAGSVETSIQLTAQAAISTVGFNFFAERSRKFYPKGPKKERVYYESHPDVENGWEGENLVLDCSFGEKRFDVLVSPEGKVLGVREKPEDNTYWGGVGIPQILDMIKNAPSNERLDEVTSLARADIDKGRYTHREFTNALEAEALKDKDNFQKYLYVSYALTDQELVSRHLDDPSTVIYYMHKDGYELVQGNPSKLLEEKVKFMLDESRVDEPVYLCLLAGKKKDSCFGTDRFTLADREKDGLYTNNGKCARPKHGEHRSAWITQDAFMALPYEQLSLYFMRNKKFIAVTRMMPYGNDEFFVAEQADFGRIETDQKIWEYIKNAHEFLEIKEDSPFYARVTEGELEKAREDKKLEDRKVLVSPQLEGAIVTRFEEGDEPEGKTFEGKIDEKLMEMFGSNEVMDLFASVFGSLAGIIGLEELHPILEKFEIVGIEKSDRASLRQKGKTTVFVNITLLEDALKEDRTSASALLYISVMHSLANMIAEKMDISPEAFVEQEGKTLKKYLFEILKAETDYALLKKVFDKYFKNNAYLEGPLFPNSSLQEKADQNKKDLMRIAGGGLVTLLDPGYTDRVFESMKTMFRNMNRIAHFMCYNFHVGEAFAQIDFFRKKLIYPADDREKGSKVQHALIESLTAGYFLLIQKCKNHKPYLLRILKSVFPFVRATVWHPSSRQLMMHALITLRQVPDGVEHTPLDNMRRERQKYDLMAEGSKILNGYSDFTRTKEDRYMRGLLVEASVSSFYWDTARSDLQSYEKSARPYIYGRKGEVVDETLRRDLVKLWITFDIHTAAFNLEAGALPKRRFSEIEKRISGFNKELLKNPMADTGFTIETIPLVTFFLGICYRGLGDLELTRQALETALNMISAKNVATANFTETVIPALLFTYESLHRKGKSDDEMVAFLGKNAKFLTGKSKILNLFALLREGKYDEIATEDGETGIDVYSLDEYITAALCQLFALVERGDEEAAREAVLSIFNLTEDEKEKELLVYHTTILFLFLPDDIKEKAGKALTRAIADSKIDPKNKKAIIALLMAVRDRSFYEYLKEIFPQTLEGKEVNGFAASEVIDMLERLCCVDLRGFLLSAVNADNIADAKIREKVRRLIREAEKAVEREPEVFTPRIEELFTSGKYQRVIQEVDELMTAERSLGLLENAGFAFGLARSVTLKERSQKIISLSGESRSLYREHDYPAAIQKLEEVITINPQDADAQSLLALRKRMQEAEEAYRRNEMDRAIDIAKEVKRSTGDKGDNVPDEFMARIGEYRKAEGLLENNPQETVVVLGSILQKFPGDPVASSLLQSAQAKMATIQLMRSEGRKELDAGNFEKAKDHFLEAVRMAKDMNGPRREATSALSRIYNKGNYETSLNMAEELLGIYPGDTTLLGVRNRSRAQITISGLRPHLQVLDFVISAKKHETDRLKRKYGSLRYSYAGIEFTSEGFTVKGLCYEKTGVKAGKQPITSAREIAFVGDSFRIVPADGISKAVEKAKYALRMAKTPAEEKTAKKLLEESESEAESVDYFVVKEMNGDSITFKFDNIEQRDRAVTTIKKKGFIEKAGDVSLIRQKEALEGALKRLERDCSNPKEQNPSTGNRFLDPLLGLNEREVKDAGSVKLSLLDERVRGDEAQMKAILQGVSPVNEVTLIQGPPGTGKTTTIAEIANFYAGMRQRVLIVSQSNAAVNNVAERLKEEGVPFARVGNREEKISEKLKRGWKKRGEVLERLKKQYITQPRKGFVILGTNNGFYNDKHVKASSLLDAFDVVIVEEAGRATVAETLVPMKSANSKVILVGDHKQLPAFGLSPEDIDMVEREMNEYGFRINGAGPPEFKELLRASLGDYRVSLFERVFRKVDDGTAKLDAHTLSVNRRSHPLIVGLVNIFYPKDKEAGYLKTFDPKKAKLKPRDHDKDKKEKAEKDTLKLIDVQGRENTVDHSVANFREIDIILEELQRIYDQRLSDGTPKYNAGDITIISPYLAQNQEIALALKAKVIVDKIRKAPKRGINLTQEEKSILEACLKKEISAHRDAKGFVGRFIQHPYPGELTKFLSCLKFKIPAAGKRLLMALDASRIDIKVSTIDSIQGQENKVVIVSMVRSNDQSEIGFLKTPDGIQRLNVSMSRAQEKMVIIGDFTHTLTNTPVRTAQENFTAIRNYVKKFGDYVRIDDKKKRAPPRGQGRGRGRGQRGGRGFHSAVAFIPGASASVSTSVMIAVIAIVAIFIIYKILRWYFSQKPLILKEKMDDVLFVKGDKKVYFPGKILSKLHHMTKIARELKIEMGADMEIEDGKAVDVIYEDDPNKIAVITADLPAETRMNTTSYYTDTYMSLAMLRNWASYYLGKNTLKKLSEAGIRERFEKNAREAKEAFSRHHSKISYFSQNKGERVDIDSQNILSVLDLPEDELKKFAEDLYHISTAATEWIGATSIAERRGKVDAEYIHFHNHPIGYPSPPSAIREGGKVWGDIYSPNFFKGRVSGLILDTEKGDELFLLYETDDSSEQEYIDMYEKYWEEGDVVENRKACILEDLRKVSMTPTDKINLESLQSQIRDIVVTKAKDIMLEERYRKEIKVVERKKGGDRATIADVKIGKLLKKKLTKLIPGSVVIEEESFTPEYLEKSKKARFVWVVDPIDGTAAYEEGVKEGNDEYCVGICLLYNGKPILSTVYSPEYEIAGHTGCLFEARDDLEGAYLNGKRVQMDQGVNFENGRCITHIHKDKKGRNDIEKRIARLFGTDGTIKAYVGHSTLMHYCFVASGMHRGPQAFTRRMPNIWDVIQSAYIVEKAGGVVMHPDGQSITPVDFNKLELVEEEKDGVKNYKLLVPFNIACSAGAKDRILESIGETPDSSGNENAAAMPLVFAMMDQEAMITIGLYILLGIFLLSAVIRIAYNAGLFNKLADRSRMIGGILHWLYGMKPGDRNVAEVLLRNAPIPFHILDENGIIQRVNPMWLQKMGFRESEEKDIIGKKTIFDFIDKDQRENARARFHARIEKWKIRKRMSELRLNSRKYAELQRQWKRIHEPAKTVEYRVYRKRGEDDGEEIKAKTDDTITEEVSLFGLRRKITVITSFQDITELRKLHDEKAEDAKKYRKLHDEKEEVSRLIPDTKMYNVRHLKAEIDAFMRHEGPNGREAAVLAVSLDAFNDYKGNQDEFAETMYLKMKEYLDGVCGSAPYILTYLGNGVYGVLIHDDQEEVVEEKVKRIVERLPIKLKQNVVCGGKEYTLHGTVTTGVALFPHVSEDADYLVYWAKRAQMKAKSVGKTFWFCDDDLKTENTNQETLERRLQDALYDPEDHGFYLNYQPQVNLKTNEIEGVEALIRWNDLMLGNVIPGEFIPLAEDREWIGCITGWVLLEACEQAYAWQQKGHKTKISINISAKDLYRPAPTIVDALKDALGRIKEKEAREKGIKKEDAKGLLPGRIALEITEHSVVKNKEQAVAIIRQLQEIGVDVHIDDFGVKESALIHLSELPCNVIKLDMEFIKDIGRKPSKSTQRHINLVRGIINMAHDIGVKVVAEGVETREQLDLLKSFGCDYAQGFFKGNGLGRPAPPSEIEKALEKEKASHTGAAAPEEKIEVEVLRRTHQVNKEAWDNISFPNPTMEDAREVFRLSLMIPLKKGKNVYQREVDVLNEIKKGSSYLDRPLVFMVYRNEKGEVRGYILGEILEGSGTVKILQTAVDKRYQRKGIATALNAKFLQHLEGMGYKSFSRHPIAEGTQKIGQRFGFTRIEGEDVPSTISKVGFYGLNLDMGAFFSEVLRERVEDSLSHFMTGANHWDLQKMSDYLHKGIPSRWIRANRVRLDQDYKQLFRELEKYVPSFVIYEESLHKAGLLDRAIELLALAAVKDLKWARTDGEPIEEGLDLAKDFIDAGVRYWLEGESLREEAFRSFKQGDALSLRRYLCLKAYNSGEEFGKKEDGVKIEETEEGVKLTRGDETLFCAPEMLSQESPESPAPKKEEAAEAAATDKQTIWRNVSYTEEMLLCLIEEMISLGFNKEIVLAFDTDIGTDQAVNPLDKVLAALSNLKQNPRYAPILKNLKIVTASPENMRSEIEKTAGKDAEVFMFSRYRHHEKLVGLELEERIHAVYIDEIREEDREFGKRAYYPLAEIVVISIAQAIAPIIAKNKITTVLKVPGLEDIVLHDINIESVLQKGNTLFFTLLPDAKEYDMRELIKKYAELKRFLKAA